MSIITPVTAGQAIVPTGPLGRGHYAIKSRALAGAEGQFTGPYVEASLHLPEFVPPNATLHFDFEQWLGYREPAGLGHGGVISTPDAMLAVARLSPRTVQNAAGGIDLLGSSIIARDYSAAGLARGVPIETLSVNWLLRSGDLGHAVWSKGGVSVPAGPVAPDGVQAWGRLTENSAGGQHYIWQSIGAVAVGDLLTLTVDVRATGIGAARHVFITADGEGYGVFNPATGAVVSSAGVTASVEPRGGGAFRIRVTVTKTNTNGTVFIGLWNPAGNNVYVGDGVSCVDAWGAQAEKRGTPTSYMPTVDTTAARYADEVSLAPGSWFNHGGAGTLMGGWVIPYDDPVSTFPGIATFSNGKFNNRIGLYHRTIDDTSRLVVWAAGVEQADQMAAVYAYGAVRRSAVAWSANDVQGCCDGVLSTVDASVTIPTGLTRLDLGALTPGLNLLNGWLRHVTYWPYRMAGAELQARTAA